MSLEIRLLQRRDLPQVADIFRSVPSFFYPEDLAHYQADHEAWLAGNDAHQRTFYVACPAEAPDRPIGTLGYRREADADRVWNLQHFAVHQDARGQGVGKALLQHVEAELRANGGRLLYAWTSPNAYTAATRAFYEAVGFTQEAVVPDYWRDGDALAIYGKRL